MIIINADHSCLAHITVHATKTLTARAGLVRLLVNGSVDAIERVLAAFKAADVSLEVPRSASRIQTVIAGS